MTKMKIIGRKDYYKKINVSFEIKVEDSKDSDYPKNRVARVLYFFLVDETFDEYESDTNIVNSEDFSDEEQEDIMELFSNAKL